MSAIGFLIRSSGRLVASFLVALSLLEGVPFVGPTVNLCLEIGFMFVQRAEQELGQPSFYRCFSENTEAEDCGGTRTDGFR